MNGANQYCTITQAIAFKKYGIVQESVFYWDRALPGDDESSFGIDYNPDPIRLEKYKEYLFSAYTSQELRILLPDALISPDGKHAYALCERKGIALYNYNAMYIQRLESGNDHPVFFVNDKNECQARALLLLDLLKYKRVEVSVINEHLINFHNTAV